MIIKYKFMEKDNFAGDKKKGESWIAGPEKKLADFLLPFVPKWLETYHLTLTTILWSGLVIIAGFLSKENIHFFWLSSAAIFLQYITDLLDGRVGRERKTGLIRWGYYMDHFLDYIFLCSILISYYFVVAETYRHFLFFTLVVFGAYMVNSYLSFSVTNEFKIAYLKIGPTEIRIFFIAVNTFIIFGKTYAAIFLPYILILSFLGLCVVVFRTQKYIWKIDMKNKENR